MTKEKNKHDLNEYYQNCPFPKPKQNKKKLLYNGYKNKQERRCHYTGALGAERHEIWGGPWRQTSIEMGFQVDLCPELHRQFHAHSPWAEKEILKWQMYYQQTYEEKLIKTGITLQQARACWMALIGKNYLHEV